LPELHLQTSKDSIGAVGFKACRQHQTGVI
jgi:hypothetical protein